MEHALVHKDEDGYLGKRLVHMWRFTLTWPTMNDIPINLHCCSWCGAIWSSGQAWLGTIDFRCVCIESNERSVVNGISHLLELHRRNSNGIQCKFTPPPFPIQYYVKLPRAKFGVWHACNLSAKPGVAIYKRHTVLNDIQRLILTVHCAGKCIRNSKVVILLCVSKKITVSRPQKCIVHFSLNMTAAFLLSSIPKLSLGVRWSHKFPFNLKSIFGIPGYLLTFLPSFASTHL